MSMPTNPNKKMYKVISPIEKRGGGTYWMRVGSAFTNKDESINLYLDAMPAPNGKSFQLQIRELNDEDLRRRESYAADHGGIGGGPSSRAVTTSVARSGDEIPF